jgi:hypothetical protein
MAATSPLEHDELRHIEKALDDGNTSEAAQLLGRFANSRDHEVAITFLATRLLFQRGRVDAEGAADRLHALIERVDHFPEAEDWLAELEGRTEPSAIVEPLPAAGAVEGEIEADVDGDEPTAPSHPPPSRAPSVPRTVGGDSHPYLDNIDDEVTPAETPEASSAAAARASALRPDSSAPPPRPPAPRLSKPPGSVPGEPASPRAYKPFDSLRAKERLSAQAGRYRASSYPDELRHESPPGGQADGAGLGGLSETRRRILEAWELVLGGRLEQARALIPEEPSPAELDAESRVALARILLELGQAERAAVEATLALDAEPELAEAQLMFVWSAVRHARQRDDAWSLERAEVVLKVGDFGPPPEGGLVLALTACVEARIGTPAVALRLAQRALRANAESIDGLAALAEAAALCGEEQRAEAALERLFSVSESAAEQVSPRLRRLGVGEQGPTSSSSLWLPLEHTLSSGARDVALEGLEALAKEKLDSLSLRRPADREAAGRAISEFLTLAPVFRHFGLYDLSTASLLRLDVALGLLYGSGPRALDLPGASVSLWQMSGLYLGETLRAAYAGRWQDGDDLENATLVLQGKEIQPFQIVRHRIAHGRHATLESALSAVLDPAPARALAGWEGARRSSPPLPWGNRDWPGLEDLPRLGRALGHSVVAVFCASHGTPALDRTAKTLAALDRYVALVAPADLPLPEDAAWTRWLASFLGAYLGEVLCKEFGGSWVRGDGPGPQGAAIQLAGRRVEPLALLLATLSGGPRASLADYAAELRQAVRTSELPRQG